MFYLDEDYRMVELDVRNVMLEGRIMKEGEERSSSDSWRFEGYHSSVKNLLKAYLKKSLNSSGAKQAKDLIAEIERIEHVVEEKGQEAGKVMARYMAEENKTRKE